MHFRENAFSGKRVSGKYVFGIFFLGKMCIREFFFRENVVFSFSGKRVSGKRVREIEGEPIILSSESIDFF